MTINQGCAFVSATVQSRLFLHLALLLTALLSTILTSKGVASSG